MEENTCIKGARGSHVWWHWNATLSSITGWHTTLLVIGCWACRPPQLQIICHGLYHARGIVHLHEFLVALKNQEDEIDHREVINDDFIYDICVMNVLPKQVLAQETEFWYWSCFMKQDFLLELLGRTRRRCVSVMANNMLWWTLTLSLCIYQIGRASCRERV